jgi:phospholipid/cholesterol/gamma-HCH transport system ATP-binding protein
MPAESQRAASPAGTVCDDTSTPAVEFRNVRLAFDEQVVLDDLSFCAPRGGMRILLGASGAGKSLVLKLILGLLRPDSGEILVNGSRIDTMRERDLLRLRAEIGMLFQETALFDSLTVDENVGYRLYEESDMPREQVRARVEEVLGFVGLSEFIDRMPATLSGGQRRRVAIGRAMAHKPDLILFDDPTVGLDPIIAASIDDEIVKLRDFEQVTSIVVTHQIRDAHYIATKAARRTPEGITIVDATEEEAARAIFLVLRDGRIQFEGTTADLLANPDPDIKEFLYRTLPPW